MARRRSTIRYKTGTGAKAKVVADTIWVQQLNPDQARGTDIYLQLFKGEDGKAVLTEDNKGVVQYQCSIPMQGEAYAYIPVNAMKALIATSRVRTLEEDGTTWIHLTFDSLTPSHSDFARATAVTEVK